MTAPTVDIAATPDVPPAQPTQLAPPVDPTQTTTDDNGVIRTVYVAPAVVSKPSINITIQTNSFEDLKTELQSLCDQVSKLAGDVPANFNAQLPNGGQSYVNYYFTNN